MAKYESGRDRQKKALVIVLIVMAFGIVISLFINSLIPDVFDTSVNHTEQSTQNIITESGQSNENTPQNELLVPVVVREVKNPKNIVVKKENEELDVLLIGVQIIDDNVEQANAYINSLIKTGQTIYLQYDEAETNSNYQRLCYVWLNNEVDIENINDLKSQMVNCLLIENGYAKPINEYPNSRYEFTFNQLVPENKE